MSKIMFIFIHHTSIGKKIHAHANHLAQGIRHSHFRKLEYTYMVTQNKTINTNQLKIIDFLQNELKYLLK